MDSHQNTLCRKCNQYIKTPHFLVHNEKCKGVIPSKNISKDRVNPLSIQRMSPNSEQEQKIPCHFCGYLQTFAELDSHPSRCLHSQQQCLRCHNKFPKSLMGQHQIVCYRGHQQLEEEEDYQMEQYPRFIPHIHRRRQNHPFLFMQRMLMSQSLPLRRNSERSYDIQNRQNSISRQRLILMNRMEDLIRLLAGQVQGEDGLPKQEIKKFPVSKFIKKSRKQGQQDMCIICYCQFQEGQQFMALPCKHIFHPECVRTWLQKNPSCPVCKRKYTSSREEEEEQF